jgi:hypothetical protein
MISPSFYTFLFFAHPSPTACSHLVMGRSQVGLYWNEKTKGCGVVDSRKDVYKRETCEESEETSYLYVQFI